VKWTIRDRISRWREQTRNHIRKLVGRVAAADNGSKELVSRPAHPEMAKQGGILLRIARWIERADVIRFFLGRAGRYLWPVLMAPYYFLLQGFQGESQALFDWPTDVGSVALVWWPLLPLAISHWVTHELDKETTRTTSASKKEELCELLEWMHETIFSTNMAVRITVLDVVKNGDQRFLRVFCRPRVFEISSTKLRIDATDRDRCEGVAGQAWFDGMARDVSIGEFREESPELYLKASLMPADKAMKLKRKARYYLACPLGLGPGEPIGVLVVDNSSCDQILDGLVREQIYSGQAVRLLSDLVARKLSDIPNRAV